MSVNNTNNRIGLNSRGYLKTPKFNIGSIRLLFITVVYLNFLIYAQGQLVDRVKYYEVTGRTTAEFDKNWDAIQKKQGFVGYCLWQPVLRHGYTHTQRGYKPSNLNLKVYVVLTLPRATYPPDMGSDVRAFYNHKIQQVVQHELTHRAFKIQFYNQFVKDFRGIPPTFSVDELYNQSNQLLWRLYNQTKAKDAHFDRNGHK